MVLSDASCEVGFIQNCLDSVSFHVGLKLFGDNKGSLCLAKGPAHADHQI